MGTAREPVVGSADLAGVDGKCGKLLLVRFRHDGLLPFVVDSCHWTAETAAAVRTMKTARIRFGTRAANFKIGRA